MAHPGSLTIPERRSQGYVSAVSVRRGGDGGIPASGRSAWPRASWRGASQVVEDAVDDPWFGHEILIHAQSNPRARIG